MEATRLIDPAFWASGSPAFPGVDRPAWAGEAPGLVWFRTSGTTGTPRWIGHSRAGLLLSAAVVNRHLGVGPGDTWALALPLRHVGGFGVVARAFEAGARLEVHPGPWDAARFVAWLESCGAHHLSLVPTQVHDLVAAGLRAPAGLRTVVVGGGVLAAAEGIPARRLGWPVLPSYGMTEAASQIATASPEVLDEPYFEAPLPVLPHWEVGCRDDGRIAIRGGALFEVEAVEDRGAVDFRSHAGGWHVTGDLGRLVAGGIEVLGRADTRVKVLGELVDPGAVGRAIGLPGGVVVALPDARRGHRLVLAVETEDDGARRRLEEHNARAPGPERVDGLVEVGPFPRGELGKVRHAELARRVAVMLAAGGPPIS